MWIFSILFINPLRFSIKIYLRIQVSCKNPLDARISAVYLYYTTTLLRVIDTSLYIFKYITRIYKCISVLWISSCRVVAAPFNQQLLQTNIIDALFFKKKQWHNPMRFKKVVKNNKTSDFGLMKELTILL